MGEVGHFRKHQQVVAPEAVRALPLIAVFVETGKGDIVPRLFVGSIAPNRGLSSNGTEMYAKGVDRYLPEMRLRRIHK